MSHRDRRVSSNTRDTENAPEAAGGTAIARSASESRPEGRSADPLDQVLSEITHAITRDVGAESTFVWVAEDGGPLVLRAASEQYARSVGKLTMQRGEGFAGWVAEHGVPISIPDGALADPRARYFPEFEEEKYQAMTTVPIVGSDGSVIGALGLHAKAPRVLDEEHSRLLRDAARLVGLAVDRSRPARAHAAPDDDELESLARLSTATTNAASLGELLPVVASEARILLRASAVQVYIRSHGRRLRRCACSTDGRTTPRHLVSTTIEKLVDGDADDTLFALPLQADGDTIGFLVVEGHPHRPHCGRTRRLGAVVAAQAAAGIRKIELAGERSAHREARQLFEAIGDRQPRDVIIQHLRRVGIGPTQALVAIHARQAGGYQEPARGLPDRPGEQLAWLLSTALPGLVYHTDADEFRALVPTSETTVGETMRRLRATLDGDSAGQYAVGASEFCCDPESLGDALVEAGIAARSAESLGQGLVSAEELGAQRYVIPLAECRLGRDPYRAAIRRLVEHDRRRQTDLLRTLELFLREGTIATVARLLYIHPNTLRQRLQRVVEISGLAIGREDRLAIEIAIRLVRLTDPTLPSVGMLPAPGARLAGTRRRVHGTLPPA